MDTKQVFAGSSAFATQYIGHHTAHIPVLQQLEQQGTPLPVMARRRRARRNAIQSHGKQGVTATSGCTVTHAFERVCTEKTCTYVPRPAIMCTSADASAGPVILLS